MLREFSALRVLEVQSSCYKDGYLSTFLELAHLPKQLTVLSLSFEGAMKLPMVPISALPTARDSPDLGGDAHFWLRSSFPCLKRATFWHSKGPAEVEHLRERLHLFPDSLESLRWYAVISDFSVLPRGLTWLELARTQLSSTEAAALPRGLTALYGLHTYGVEAASLPRTIKRGNCVRIPDNLLTPQMAAALPPLLESLLTSFEIPLTDYASQGIFWPSALPSLTEMELSGRERPFPFEVIAALPRTLMRIEQVIIDWSALEAELKAKGLENEPCDFWPPNLLTLTSHPNCTPMSPERHFKMLPRSLTVLTNVYASLAEDINQWIRFLPTGLIELEIHGDPDHLTFDWDLEEPLPLPHLRHFHSDLDFDPSSFRFLPRGLLILRLPSLSLEAWTDARQLAKLPPTLEKLQLHTLKSTSYHYLPSSLRHLMLEDWTGPVPSDTVLPNLKKFEIMGDDNWPIDQRVRAWLKDRNVAIDEPHPEFMWSQPRSLQRIPSCIIQ